MNNCKYKELTNTTNDEIDKCETLEDLFILWKKAQINDKLYKYDTPEINGKFIRMDSFIEDGFCVTDQVKKDSILYISKESHSFNENNIETENVSSYTYLKTCKENNIKTIFARRIFMMQSILNKELGVSNDNISFMNINKRGGFRHNDMSVLNVYALEFKDYIIREIEIINPKMIICCGRGIKRIIEMIYTKNNKICNLPLIEMEHPSYFGIKEKKNEEVFKNRLYEILRNKDK